MSSENSDNTITVTTDNPVVTLNNDNSESNTDSNPASSTDSTEKVVVQETNLDNTNEVSNDTNPETVLEPREKVTVNVEAPAEAPTDAPVNEEESVNKETPVNDESYDTELLDTTYDLLTSLVQGMEYNQNNWMLLLSKAMMLVSKNKKMKPIQKIKLSVDLVIKYLDDNTELEDKVLAYIRVNVRNMCESMVNNNKTKKKVKKDKVKLDKVDEDVVASPLQITNQLISKIKNLVKSKNMTFSDLQKNVPEIVIMCINTFKKYKHLTNIEKKNLLIQTLTQFLRQELPKLIKMTEEQTESVNFIVDSIPNTIETLNNVVHGKDIKLDFRDPGTQMMLMTVLMKLKPLLSCFKKEK